MATVKKPVKKAPTSKATTKSAVKKAVAKKPVAAKTTKKSGGKKKHIVRRILDFKIKGWVSRKTIVIGGVVAVLLVGGFAGYAVWQNMSANAGGTCTLGRSGKSKSTGSFSTKLDEQKYNTCKANAAAQARAEAEAKARAAAAAKAAQEAAAKKKIASKSTPAPSKTTSKPSTSTSTQSQSKAVSPTQPTKTGWTTLSSKQLIQPTGTKNLAEVAVYACKVGSSSTNSKIKAQIKVLSNNTESGYNFTTRIGTSYEETQASGETSSLAVGSVSTATTSASVKGNISIFITTSGRGYTDQNALFYSTSASKLLTCA